jgi:MSHA biogenesis protein MshQ
VESLQTVMNATLTSLIDMLWRWQRGLARALLLVGALAGMTLGTVAHAQVAFRSASSATQPVPTFGAASSAIQAAPPAPAFQAAGAAVEGQGAVTPVWPAHEIDDIALLFIESAGGEAATLSTAAGFVAVANSPQATGATTAGTRITVFWARATSTSMASPTVADPGNHVYARILTYRGVFASGNPWDVTGGGVKAGASTSVTVTGVTTTVANTLIVQAVARDNDNAAAAFSAQTNGNLTGIAERSDAGTAQGNGGGIGVWDGVKAAAGGTGNTAATVTNSINAFLTIALRPPTSALTITRPAGTIQNDVMVASFGFRTNQPGLSTDVDITPPVGWTLVRRLDNPGPTDSGLAVYQRVAGAAEPASYRWGLTCIATCATNGFQAAVGGITSFSNVNTTTPVDVENGVNTAIGAQTAPSVTTTVANAMLVASHSYASAGTWTPPPASGGDAAMTEAVDMLSGTQSTEMSYVLHAAAGATSAKQATPNPDDDEGNAHILALRPALQSSITINKPAGTIQNDVMIASIGFSPNTLTITTVPAGWTLVRRVDNTNANANSLAVYRKVAGAAEPASYAWVFSAAGYLAGGISTFSGVDTTTPVDIENGNCTQQGSCATTTLSHATPSVATTVANTMLVTSHTYSSAGTWTPPGAMTEAVEDQHGNQSLGVNYVLQAATGATGAKTATASTQADVGNAHILALRPAAVVVPTPGSFNAFETSTAAGAITGVIRTKVAGSAFSLDVVAIAAGVQQAGFTDAVIVELLGNNTLGVALNAQNCPTSFTLVQTVAPNPTITAGRSTVNFAAVAESWRDVRVRVRWTTASPTVTWCSTDNFAIRPNTFASFAVTDTDWQTAGTVRTLNNTGATGGNVHKAGLPFTVRADAVNGAGAPVVTTNYTGTPTPTPSDCGASTACPATLGTVTLGSSFVAGVLTANTASYSEVGSFALQLVDSTFSSVDAADGSTPTERNIASSTINVGRFVPDHFDVTSVTAPEFRTFNDAACATRSFTYIGQRFGYATIPAAMIAAKNSSGGTTTNYTGALWKLTNTSASQTFANSPVMSLDTAGIAAPTVSETAGTGTGTYTANAIDAIAFVRDNATPQAPFNSNLSLTLSVSDASEAGASQGTITTSTPLVFNGGGSGIGFDSGNAFRYGRLAIRNANGSQLVPLPVLMETQYWNGSTFITHSADSCTTVTAANIGLGNYTGNLGAGETTPTVAGGAFSSGRKLLTMSAPGAANNGSVDIVVNLGSTTTIDSCLTWGTTPTPTGANLSHLRGLWCGATYTKDPTARATFGVFKGAEEVIFIRENF